MDSRKLRKCMAIKCENLDRRDCKLEKCDKFPEEEPVEEVEHGRSS